MKQRVHCPYQAGWARSACLHGVQRKGVKQLSAVAKPCSGAAPQYSLMAEHAQRIDQAKQ